MNPRTKTLVIQISLFIVTVVTTTLSGTEWIYGRGIVDSPSTWLNWGKILDGLKYSIPFLGILTVHEFGHYFVARKNKVEVTLPYYIPFWFGFGFSLGTFGAFIRIKAKNLTNRQYFDIGIAGPLAGFIVAIILLFYGFTHLPPRDYFFTIFPELAKYGNDYIHNLPKGSSLVYLGDNLIFQFFEKFVANPSLVPPKYEMMHYPILFAGYLALFFTSLNLLPIGQLDGGHVLYGLVGHQWHFFLSKSLFIAFLLFAGIGVASPYMDMESLAITLPLYVFFLYSTLRSAFIDTKNRWMVAVGIASTQFLLLYMFPKVEGYPNWLVFGFILGRFLGIEHPKAEELKIGWGRKALGWLCLLIFVLCFSPQPFKSS
jgi:membrane-associated protease RseP (regulator of RpoE activity)